MNVGQLIKITRAGSNNAPLVEVEQKIGLIIRDGNEYTGQMIVLCNGGIKYWFVDQCVLIT